MVVAFDRLQRKVSKPAAMTSAESADYIRARAAAMAARAAPEAK